jgi:two-component system, OmpR family, sensor histidine kinase KdpD
MQRLPKAYSFPTQPKRAWQRAPWSFALALCAVLAMTGIIIYTHADTNMVNIPPLYLLVVQAVAVLIGSRAAVLASFLSFLAFDWFFVDPRYQFTVRDPFEFVALCVFLATAILVGQLTALFQSRAQAAKRRELAATAMASASWTVASDLDRDSALRKVLEQLRYVDSVQSACVLIINQMSPPVVAAGYQRDDQSAVPAYREEAVKFVRDTGRAIGWEENEHWKSVLKDEPASAYLPVRTEEEVTAVLFVSLQAGKQWLAEDKQVTGSLLNHIAVVLQRDRLMSDRAKVQALAEADKLKTALLQMVSHDFRSPLASIKASVSNLLADEGEPIDGATQKGLLEAIEGEADRLNRVVGNILDLSRLEADAWKPRREPASITELVGSALDCFSAHDNERIVVALPPNLAEVSLDSVQIVQVLKNLLENGLKYSPMDSKVELIVNNSTDGWLEFNVLDRGTGLPPGEEAQVFEPFFRAGKHRESSVPGVGMGLAICRGLVEAHGGKLTAYNRDGGGAVFCARVPCNIVTSDETNKSTSNR